MQELDFNIYAILILFGAFQGFLLSLLLISSERFRKKSNAFLALLLFTLSLLNLIGGMQSTGFFEVYPVAAMLPIGWEHLIPVCIYFFIIYLVNPHRKFRKWEYLLFMPFVFDFVLQTNRFIAHYSSFSLGSETLDRFNSICGIFDFFPIVFTLAVVAWSVRKIDNYHINLLDWYSEFEDISLRWLKYTLICGGLLAILWALVTYSDIASGETNFILARILWLGLSINIYWIGYSIFFRRELFEANVGLENGTRSSKKPVELSNKTEEHYKGLIKLLTEEKIYRNPDLSMSILSQRSGLSNGYLSQIINHKEGKNFFDFVNSYRIEEVKQNLGDPKFDHYSILGIALQSGFKSKSTFNAVFKKMTGETPSMYKGKKER